MTKNNKAGSFDLKVFVPLLVSLVIVILIFLSINEFYGGVNREKVAEGLSEFYENDYYTILNEQKTHYCSLKVRIMTETKTISINSNCVAEYPYSAFEAFIAVARGNVTTGESIYYTNLERNDDEIEAARKRLQLIQYPIFASSGNGTAPENTTNLCFLPCSDGIPSSSFEVLSVNYTPDRESLSKLFEDYSLEKFNGLKVYSNYSYRLYYDSMENIIEWRYLISQFDLGSFDLEIESDRPPAKIENKRDEIKSLVDIPEEEYEITEVNENKFIVKGVATGVDMLVIKW